MAGALVLQSLWSTLCDFGLIVSVKETTGLVFMTTRGIGNYVIPGQLQVGWALTTESPSQSGHDPNCSQIVHL